MSDSSASRRFQSYSFMDRVLQLLDDEVAGTALFNRFDLGMKENASLLYKSYERRKEKGGGTKEQNK